MNNTPEKLIDARAIVNVLGQTTVVFAICATVLAVSHASAPYAALSGIILLIAALLFLLRRSTPGFKMFLLSHTVLLLLSVYALLAAFSSSPQIGLTVLAPFSAVLLLLASVIRSVAKTERTSPFALILIGILYFNCLALHDSRAAGAVWFSMFCLLLLDLFRRNLEAADTFIESHGGCIRLDAPRLRRVNAAMTCFYVAAAGAVLLLVSRIPWSGANPALLEGCRAVIRFLFWLLTLLPVPESLLRSMQRAAASDWLSFSSGSTNIFFIVLEKVLEIAVEIALILFLCRCLFLGAGYLYRRYGETMTAEEERSYLYPFERRKKTGRRAGSKDGAEEGAAASLRTSIRRIYRRGVQGFWGRSGNAPVSLTPKEQLDSLSRNIPVAETGSPEEKSSKKDRILSIYEKARYGRGKLEHSDVSLLRRLLRSWKKKS
ncbi:MAG: hypothetical protein LKJ76_10350 [Lachnospiraceae bacterium]|jgi:hypothetical protein|nr:hypothetical protein [Lachnospiraceae bacterium]